jgi:hypothetical protein
MGRIIERIGQIAQVVERSGTRLLVRQQHAGIDEQKHHEKWTGLATKASLRESEQEDENCDLTETSEFLRSDAWQSPSSLVPRPHCLRTSNSEEFEESFSVLRLVKSVFVYFEFFLPINRLLRMVVIPHLPVSMPNVKKLAELLLLLLPIDPLTSSGTIQGRLALSAVLELEISRCYGATDDAALGHHCCWSRVVVLEWYVMQCSIV